MPNEKILLVEDDPDIVEMLTYNLDKEGFVTNSVLNGEEALTVIAAKHPDLVLLDLMLPGIDGLGVCKAIRKDEDTARIPIIMLTAKTQEIDKIIGFELGADDYITKPFSPRELIARVKAVLRRYAEPFVDKRIEIMDLVVDILKHKITVFGTPVELTHTEFKLLAYMAQRPGIVLTRDRILSDVFGYKSEIYDRTVDNHIKTLRKKLGKARDYIETVRGLGYSFREA